MKAKHILKGLVAIVVLCVATACVDKEFRLDEASTEITVAQGTTTLKLGYLNEKKLGDIIDLTVDESGNYQLGFTGEGGEISIEGINRSFELPDMTSDIWNEYPNFELRSNGYMLDKTYSIKPKLLNSEISGTSIPVSAGYTISGSDSRVIKDNISFQVPEQISAVDCVYLEAEENTPGAKIYICLSLNDLAQVSAGGHIGLEFSAPEGFALYDNNHKLLEDGCFKVSDYAFTQEQREIEFELYLKSIENKNPIVDGELSIPIQFDYNVSFDITTRKGTLQLRELPELRLYSSIMYDDADFELNEVTIVEYNEPMRNSMYLNGIPEQIKSIKEIELAGASPINFFVDGFEWIDDQTASLFKVKTTLPEYLTIKQDESVEYDAETHTLSTDLCALRKGITLLLDAITFEGEGLEPEYGGVELNFSPNIVVSIDKGSKVKLSNLSHWGYDFSMKTGFERTEFDIESISGRVDYEYQKNLSFNIGGVGNGGELTIDDIGLSPIIGINITNPLTINAIVSATLIPVYDGIPEYNNKVSMHNITIAAAEYAAGVTTPRTTKLILADEEHKEKYSSEEYTFVECDIAKLFEGNIPDGIEMELAFRTDSGLSTLYAAEQYTISYDYSVDIPLNFGEDMSIGYSAVIDSFGDAFSQLADAGIKAGDIYLIADIATTVPLELSFNAEMIDANGKSTAAKLILPSEGIKIEGSTDGTTPKKSSVRLGIDFGPDNKVSNLADVSGIRLDLAAKSTSSASLNPEQYISAQLYIELNDGITIDINTDDYQNDDYYYESF